MIRTVLAGLREQVIGDATQRRNAAVQRFQRNTVLLLVFGALLLLALALALLEIIHGLRERRRLLQRLEQESSHDALTQLPNKPYFLEWLHPAYEQALSDRTMLGLLHIELDNDAALNPQQTMQRVREAAKRLSNTKRKVDMLGRLGERSFGLLAPLHKADSSDLHALSLLALRLVDPLGQPQSDETPAQGRACIGVAIFPHDAPNPAALLAAAQTAVVNAPAADFSAPSLVFYGDPEGLALKRSARLRRDLTGAIERGEMFLLAQPEWRASDLHIDGAEMMLRWLHPNWVPSVEQSVGHTVPLSRSPPSCCRKACASALNGP
jgi:diguanylate cyclase (GGDEF)-like protein